MRAAAAGALALLLGGLGCTPATPHYESRGLIKARTGSGATTRYAIHHEAIAAFKDREGAAAPMASMTMVFGLAAGLTQTELAPGSKVAFAFDVHWHGGEALVLTRLDPLPADTVLDLHEHH